MTKLAVAVGQVCANATLRSSIIHLPSSHASDSGAMVSRFDYDPSGIETAAVWGGVVGIWICIVPADGP